MEAKSPSEVLAAQVTRWRTERKLSAQALHDRLAALGSKLSRRAISRIETDNRGRGISVEEWLQLAHALGVPPALLLVDLKDGTPLAVTPDVALHPWIAWEWMIGEHASPVPGPDGGAVVSRVEEFHRALAAVRLYRREGAAAEAVHRAQSAVVAAEFARDEQAAMAARTAVVDTLRTLAGVLDEMHEHDMVLPAKPCEWVASIRDLKLSRYPDRLLATGEEQTEGG